ncbi:MAG: Fur family transcriptional regulator [Rhodobacteraceae bacterium]|nr:Fur family transcriptional regulator [Paracoccaceae bacterium]
MGETIISRCEERGLRLTEQRRVVAGVLEQSRDHPGIQELYKRVLEVDPSVSIATVYRTVNLLTEIGILERHEFGDGIARFEDADRHHHDHLIDMETGKVVEFYDEQLEALQQEIARKHGYLLKDHRLELYGVRCSTKNGTDETDE